jgi:S1-C subfamily serine protease
MAWTHNKACTHLLRNLAAASVLLAMVWAHSPLWAQAAAAPSATQIERSVVKIFTTSRSPDVYRPWSKSDARTSTGSGVVIEGKRILTNAHVVNYASTVEVRAREGGDKYMAKVVAIARGIDLALLELEDESFFNGRTPPERSSVLPSIKDEVLAYGYPFGGDSLSITKGIVSRIEFVAYNAPASGLRIQVDAAINPGNSGGPVFAGSRMIGLAYGIISGANNIGYIIPNEEIALFLADIADGRYDGKPALLDDMQTLENPALRSFLKADKSVRGLVVDKPHSREASYPLKEWDIVTHIGGVEVDNQGTVPLTPEVRVGMLYLVQKAARNGSVPLTVFRKGQSLRIDVPVAVRKPRLVNGLDGNYPSYFIYGPIVFSRATLEFRNFFSNNPALTNNLALAAHPLVTQMARAPSPEREDLVVVSSAFFPNGLVKGYDNRFGSVLHSVNDQRIRSMQHLVEMLRDTKDDLVVLKFDQNNAESIVVPHRAMLSATEDILKDNGIRFQASEDLLGVWNGRKP